MRLLSPWEWRRYDKKSYTYRQLQQNYYQYLWQVATCFGLNVMGNSFGKLSAIKFLKKLDVIFKFKISFVYNFIPMPDVMRKENIYSSIWKDVKYY